MDASVTVEVERERARPAAQHERPHRLQFARALIARRKDLESQRRAAHLQGRRLEAGRAAAAPRPRARHRGRARHGRGAEITHQEMANLIGSTRETVSLTLSQFKRKGLIQTEGRKVILADPEGLRALAYPAGRRGGLACVQSGRGCRVALLRWCIFVFGDRSLGWPLRVPPSLGVALASRPEDGPERASTSPKNEHSTPSRGLPPLPLPFLIISPRRPPSAPRLPPSHRSRTPQPRLDARHLGRLAPATTVQLHGLVFRRTVGPEQSKEGSRRRGAGASLSGRRRALPTRLRVGMPARLRATVGRAAAHSRSVPQEAPAPRKPATGPRRRRRDLHRRVPAAASPLPAALAAVAAAVATAASAAATTVAAATAAVAAASATAAVAAASATAADPPPERGTRARLAHVDGPALDFAAGQRLNHLAPLRRRCPSRRTRSRAGGRCHGPSRSSPPRRFARLPRKPLAAPARHVVRQISYV